MPFHCCHCRRGNHWDRRKHSQKEEGLCESRAQWKREQEAALMVCLYRGSVWGCKTAGCWRAHRAPRDRDKRVLLMERRATVSSQTLQEVINPTVTLEHRQHPQTTNAHTSSKFMIQSTPRAWIGGTQGFSGWKHPQFNITAVVWDWDVHSEAARPSDNMKESLQRS